MSATTKAITTANNASTRLPMRWNGTEHRFSRSPILPIPGWCGTSPTKSTPIPAESPSSYDYPFDGSGRDYLIRNSEAGEDLKFQIFDITSRDTDPSGIALVSEITGTPPNSCGPGCGGDFIQRAHKGWWSEETGYFYSAAGEPGFGGALVQIWDLRDPEDPVFVGRAWGPGQKDGEEGFEGQYAHHPIVDEENDRIYAGFREAGHTASWDISDPANPTLVWMIDTSPPGRGPHTVSPIVYDEVPNFMGDATAEDLCPGR